MEDLHKYSIQRAPPGQCSNLIAIKNKLPYNAMPFLLCNDPMQMRKTDRTSDMLSVTLLELVLQSSKYLINYWRIMPHNSCRAMTLCKWDTQSPVLLPLWSFEHGTSRGNSGDNPRKNYDKERGQRTHDPGPQTANMGTRSMKMCLPWWCIHCPLPSSQNTF